MFQARLRRFGVDDNHLADGNITLEQEIERKCNHLWLPTKGCQHRVNILWHQYFPTSISRNVCRRIPINGQSIASHLNWWTSPRGEIGVNLCPDTGTS